MVFSYSQTIRGARKICQTLGRKKKGLVQKNPTSDIKFERPASPGYARKGQKKKKTFAITCRSIVKGVIQ